jgi:WhiB family redox-sensing transcriptional regulator
MDPNLFMPALGPGLSLAGRQARQAAKAVCRGCPYQIECRDYALAEPQIVGIWGGLTDGERRKLRRGAAMALTVEELSVALPEPATNGAAPIETRRVCALDGCREPATGKAKFCSTAHQRRASRQRVRARDETVEKAGAAQVVAELGLVANDGLGEALVTGPSVFASMASLAALLPVGWKLELGAGEACLRWSV